MSAAKVLYGSMREFECLDILKGDCGQSFVRKSFIPPLS